MVHGHKQRYTSIFAMQSWISLVPRPLPSFPSLVVWLSGRGSGTFPDVSDVKGRKTLIERGRAQLKCCFVSSLLYIGKTLSPSNCLVKSDIKLPLCAAIFGLE